MLKGKKIVLGITGGIAAYKAAELTRALIKEGAQVRVIMTKNATEFISPLTLQTLSNNIVYTEMYLPPEQYDMAHIALAEFADAFVIAPATGNIIGKIASGIADDLLSTTIMAAVKPTLICPAMNDKMLANNRVGQHLVVHCRTNQRRLNSRHYRCGKQIIGDSGSNLSYYISSCRSDNKGISKFRKRYMSHIILLGR